MKKICTVYFEICGIKVVPHKKYGTKITQYNMLLHKVIDKGKEIVEKFSKADNTVVKKPKSSEKIQFVHKDETCIIPKAETCNVPTDNKTKDNKPKTKNYSYNSISRSAPLMTDRQNKSRRKKIKFSDVLKHLGLEWSSIISAEPASEKAFMEYDEDIRRTQKCNIPYTLRNDKDSIKAALEYLSAKSYYTSKLDMDKKYPIFDKEGQLKSERIGSALAQSYNTKHKGINKA